MNLTHIIDEGEKEFEKAFYEIMGLETDPDGQERMLLLRDEDGTVTDGLDFSEEQQKIQSFLASRQLALLRGLEVEVCTMREPLPSANDHKEYNRGVREGVEMIRNAVLAKIQEAIKHLEKKI